MFSPAMSRVSIICLANLRRDVCLVVPACGWSIPTDGILLELRERIALLGEVLSGTIELEGILLALMSMCILVIYSRYITVHFVRSF